ncbi:hypothetical protein D5086_029551 [Populus alba]|uniref:Uncharacterized protein n=1 Tax=Populus alba TaxID=43335 RepID=A0ACC4AUQ6_POPAL
MSTDTQEIVEHNITGLLHPVGRPGSRVLAQNIELLLENPSVREQMGIKGGENVLEAAHLFLLQIVPKMVGLTDNFLSLFVLSQVSRSI